MEKKGYLHQIHPVLPVKDVVEALDFYVNRLGFKIAFADDSKNPTYAGILRDDIEIHLQWHDPAEWEVSDHSCELSPRILKHYTMNMQTKRFFMPIPY